MTIVLCSGFSVYLSERKRKTTLSDTIEFYRKRFVRIVIPWWSFLVVYFVLFRIILLATGAAFTDFSAKYILSSFLTIGGVPAGWLVLLMTVMTLAFPVLKSVYEKNRRLISGIILTYAAFSVFYMQNPIDFPSFPQTGASALQLALFSLTFLFGWSLVYMIGFFIEDMYNEHTLRKREIKITLNFLLLYATLHATHRLFGLDTSLNINKWPPTPYYIVAGIALTFIILNVFFAYRHFIHLHLRKMLSFISSNSYWIFLWSFLILEPVAHLFGSATHINVYVRLMFEFALSCLLICALVALQKKLIKIKIHKEKHHF